MILTISDRNKRRKVEFFNDFTISLRYDSVGSVFSFLIYYNPENEDHVYLAQPGKYQVVRVEHNGELLLTGLILSNNFVSSTKAELLQISGYSVPGVLEDSNIPITSYPLQNDGLNLIEITEKLLKPFVIGLEVDSNVLSVAKKVYPKTTASETQTVSDYITQLANQRDIVVSHTNTGKLLFTKANTNKNPILNLGSEQIGVTYSLNYNGQGMHDPITVIKQADDEENSNSGQYEIRNPYIPRDTNAFRPKIIVQTSGDDNDTEKVAINALKAEIKGIQLKVTLDRWDINGVIIKPNNIIRIENKELYLFNKVNWFIESVELSENTKAQTATLTCVLPDVYNDLKPTKNVFYD